MQSKGELESGMNRNWNNEWDEWAQEFQERGERPTEQDFAQQYDKMRNSEYYRNAFKEGRPTNRNYDDDDTPPPPAPAADPNNQNQLQATPNPNQNPQPIRVLPPHTWWDRNGVHWWQLRNALYMNWGIGGSAAAAGAGATSTLVTTAAY
jgi:hypothetical protein